MPAKRPGQRKVVKIPGDLASLAERCEYIGSQEHKEHRSWLGVPRPRRRPQNMATICPLVTAKERNLATGWVRNAIANRQFDEKDWRNGFPRKVWHRDNNGQYWYGILTNQGAGSNPKGQYKGWPIDEDEWREIFG